eukprot:1937104-Amphidinium_carterae.2
MSSVAYTAALFPGNRKEWLYVATTRCGAKLGRTTLALNQRWKDIAKHPDLQHEDSCMEFAMRLDTVVARKVETHLKAILTDQRATDAPQEYKNEVFTLPVRDLVKRVMEVVDAVLAAETPEDMPAETDQCWSTLGDGEHWDPVGC